MSELPRRSKSLLTSAGLKSRGFDRLTILDIGSSKHLFVRAFVLLVWRDSRRSLI